MLGAAHTTETTDDLFASFKTREGGLSESEAAARLATYGANTLSSGGLPWLSLLLRQVRSPFIYILVATAVLALFLGEPSDGIIVLSFVLINILISFFQEYHSARSLMLLKKCIAPHARVVRNGIESVVDAATLVPGDVVVIETGDIVDADIRLIQATGLAINESVLSGESAPARKIGAPLKVAALDIGEAVNMAYSGTTVTSGRGVGIVIATGRDTEIGGIATLAGGAEHLSAFESSIRMFAQFIMKMVSVILVVLLVVNIFIKGTHNIAELLLFAVALAISVIPEALPLVTTLSLSKGALKLARDHVVVKRLSAVEDLGSIEILCTDKTGTLTENKLAVSSISAADASECLGYAALAANEPMTGDTKPIDAFDAALFEKMMRREREALKAYTRLSSIPFDPDRRRVSVAVQEGGHDAEVVVRGAPETILALTTLGKEEAEKVLEWACAEGRSGRRTLAIARGACKHPNACEKDEKKLMYVGSISFTDPVKETSKGAILEAERLGIKVVILTGDGAEVAGAVAFEVGIVSDRAHVMTEAQFLALSPELQAVAVREYSVFARMSPAGKYRVIELLSKDKVVGYLGDGINDAPALKIASVGLVVSNASDIAREAADIVLLNRSLHVIIGGIKSGRAVFENTVKYLKTTLVSSFGNFYTIAIASLMLPHLPMLPIQLLLLNLVTDYPMLAIATDTVDPGDIKTPRRYSVREIVLVSIVLGLVSTLFDFIFFAIFYRAAPATLQTSWFIGSVLTELALLFAIRTRQKFWKAKAPSRWLVGLTVTAAAFAIAVPFTSFGRTFFKFTHPSVAQLGIILAIVVMYFAASEAIKLAYYRFWNHSEKDHHA